MRPQPVVLASEDITISSVCVRQQDRGSTQSPSRSPARGVSPPENHRLPQKLEQPERQKKHKVACQFAGELDWLSGRGDVDAENANIFLGVEQLTEWGCSVRLVDRVVVGKSVQRSSPSPWFLTHDCSRFSSGLERSIATARFLGTPSWGLKQCVFRKLVCVSRVSFLCREARLLCCYACLSVSFLTKTVLLEAVDQNTSEKTITDNSGHIDVNGFHRARCPSEPPADRCKRLRPHNMCSWTWLPFRGSHPTAY